MFYGRQEFFIVLDGVGAWANDRHLPHKDIKELGKLIEAGFAHKSTELRNARVTDTGLGKGLEIGGSTGTNRAIWHLNGLTIFGISSRWWINVTSSSWKTDDLTGLGFATLFVEVIGMGHGMNP